MRRRHKFPMAAWYLMMLLIFCPGLPAPAQQPIQFIGISVDKYANEADKKLQKYLENQAHISFQRHLMPYGAAVHKLAEWDPRTQYLARVTPYVCVAAEMLGAKFEILATYRSRATGKTTYHSYMVVNRESFGQFYKNKHNGLDFNSTPELSELTNYLKETQAKFIYHDKFSTSSYFLPSLYFRDQHISAMTRRISDSLTSIQLVKAPPGMGSSFLVGAVADRGAQLAAVWDGTIKEFEKENKEAFDKVHLIQLPTPLPNDFLVCRLEDKAKAEITKAIDSMQDHVKDWNVPDSDFESWVDIKDAPEALEALAALRGNAAERPAPVTIEVQTPAKDGVPREYVDAAREAIRLAGTEFVPYNAHFHQSIDVTWTLAPIHDGAIELRSEMPGFGNETQELRISFMKPDDLSKRIVEDLTMRIVDFIHSRMHRIRYVWLYEEKYPTVIRDFEFTPQPEVKVQRVDWMDPDRNGYEEDTPFTATIINPQAPDKLQLVGGQFPQGPGGAFDFEPMSNVAYRVLLKRQTHEMPLMHALTYALIALLLGGAVALYIDLRKARPSPVGLHQTCQRMAEDYHLPWRSREINEGDVLWCDPEIEQFIKQLRGRTWLGAMGDGGAIRIPFGPITIDPSFLTKVFSRLFGARLHLPPDLMDSSGVGNTAAVDNVIKYLVGRRRLSPFVGRPLEWEALEAITIRNFRRLGIGPRQGDAHLRRDTPALGALVARHFQQVLRTGERDASFFRHTWELSEAGTEYRLSYKEALSSELKPSSQEGPVSTLLGEFTIPAEPEVRDRLAVRNNDAWLLGKIIDQARSNDNGTACWRLRFKPLVLLKAEA